jgi:predicted glycoside hydrolase/deacetylase ChbG (UPF0249 family)
LNADVQAPKTLAVCADDYGWTPAIDHAILKLAADKRLSEISCLVNGDHWPQAARELTALPAVRQGRVRTGLHFNLTEGRPLSSSLRAVWPQFPELQSLIVMAHLRRLPLAELRDEWQAQMQAFEQARGRAPAHVDGHQHVHHLPGVRDIVLAALAPRADIRVRHTGRVQGPGYTVKRLLIEGTGGRAMGRQLEASGRHANTHLYGVYDFVRADYRALVQSWLAAIPEKDALIFCHPGAAGSKPATTGAAADPIAAARVREAAYLASDDFTDDLQAAGVRLA